jgi:ATP-dependent Lon protease
MPENALPKDGPSAGITIATALISAITGRPIRSGLAMTGEITLRGRVLGIGGLKEKVLAAHHANIYHLLIPLENTKDLAEIPAKIRQRIKFTIVDSMDQVIDAALLDAPKTAKSRERNDKDNPQIRPLHVDEREPATRERKRLRPIAPDDGQHKDEDSEHEHLPLIIPSSERLPGESFPHSPA